jgi:hypothetical protein
MMGHGFSARQTLDCSAREWSMTWRKYQNTAANAAKCGVGFHGDRKSNRVYAYRFGAKLPLAFQWFQQCQPVGNDFQSSWATAFCTSCLVTLLETIGKNHRSSSKICAV